MFVYYVVKIVLFTLYKILFRFKAYGAEKVPLSRDRGVILAPNHASYLDPPILGISLKRRVTYLAKDYLFKAFFVGWVLRSIEALPIKTETEDFRSIRQLLKVLKEGKCIVVFAEGTRSVDGKLKEPEQGIGFLAAKSQAAVVPVYIEGSFEAYPKGAKRIQCKPIKVYYGEPFIPAEDQVLMSAENPYMAISQKIMAEIRKIKESVDAKKV